MFRYFKRKLLLFIALIGVSFLGFFTIGHTKARENAQTSDAERELNKWYIL